MQRTIAWIHAEKHSLLIDQEYVDEGVSARKRKMDDRPALKRLLQDIKHGEVKTLFVYKRDRLARDVKEHLEIYDLLKRQNVSVIFTAGNEFPIQYSAAGEFFELVIAGFNQREAEQIAQRIRETKQVLFLTGKNHGRTLPYGYFSNESKEIERNELELQNVAFIFHELLSTQCETYSEFRRHLSDTGKVPAELTNYQKLIKLIKSKEFMGIRKAKFLDEEIEIELKRLAIISEEQWQKSNEILESLIKRRKRDSESSDALLDGLVFCGHCEAKLKIKILGGTKAAIYCCYKHQNRLVSVETLENVVWQRVVQWIDEMAHSETSGFFAEMLKQIEMKCSKAVSKLENTVELLRERIIHMTDQWMTVKDQEMQNKLLDLYDEFSNGQKKLEVYRDMLTTVQKYPIRIKQLWDLAQTKNVTLSEEDIIKKRGLVMDVVKRILIDKDFEVRIELKNPFIENVNGGDALAFRIDD